jgi:hypothetical protein
VPPSHVVRARTTLSLVHEGIRQSTKAGDLACLAQGPGLQLRDSAGLKTGFSLSTLASGRRGTFVQPMQLSKYVQQYSTLAMCCQS